MFLLFLIKYAKGSRRIGGAAFQQVFIIVFQRNQKFLGQQHLSKF